MWPRVRDDRLLLVALAGIVALTWLSLWTSGASIHSGHGTAGGSVYLSLAGWVLMVTAMMLPTTFPLVALFHSFVRARPNRPRLTAALVVGYLWVWTLIGFVVYAAGGLVHAFVEQSAWFLPGSLLLAGLYQFTPLKHMCLEKCRSPLAFIMEHWHGGRDDREAFELGMRHGVFCIGCCWTLMLLMFAVSIGNLAWMLALGAVMAVEKNVSWGRRLSAPLGAVLLISAVFVGTAWT
jgi:predicted metal-binding membrane protein